MQAKLFSQTKDGLAIHWDVTQETVDGLTNAVSQLIEWLEANEFVAHQGFGTPAAPSRLPARTENTNGHSAPPPRNRPPTRQQPRDQEPKRVSRDPNGPPTEGQIKAVYASARGAGMDKTALIEWLGDMTPEQLTKAEASEAIDDLHKIEAGN